MWFLENKLWLSNLVYNYRRYIFRKHISIQSNTFIPLKWYPNSISRKTTWSIAFKHLCSKNYALRNFVSKTLWNEGKVLRVQNIRAKTVWTSEWKIKIHFHSHRNKSQLLKNSNYSKNCDEGNCSIISFEMISMAEILILFVVLMVLCLKTIVIDALKSQVIRLNLWIVFHARSFSCCFSCDLHSLVFKLKNLKATYSMTLCDYNMLVIFE